MKMKLRIKNRLADRDLPEEQRDDFLLTLSPDSAYRHANMSAAMYAHLLDFLIAGEIVVHCQRQWLNQFLIPDVVLPGECYLNERAFLREWGNLQYPLVIPLNY